MIHTTVATRGMVVAPHGLAAQSGLAVLREGGNAIEAMVAAAATIAVVYPHMNGLGGDGFWLIVPPQQAPIGIDACGGAGSKATLAAYQGLSTIPTRGPKAGLTVAGTVGGWHEALDISCELGGALPLKRLLADAIDYASHGIPVTFSQHSATASKLAELRHIPGFAETFAMHGAAPAVGSLFRQQRLAQTLTRLAEQGLDSFYRGALGDTIAAELAALGMPLLREDLASYRARRVLPLHLQHSCGDVFNMTMPTQGLVSLLILGILDRTDLAKLGADQAEHIHLAVEATKLAFAIRDKHVTDPAHTSFNAQDCLNSGLIAQLAQKIDIRRAAPWGKGRGPGDTIWMGAIDRNGLAVSFIQSIYHEFGSGVVLPGTGLNWQNRGASFSLDPDHLLTLKPGKKPFHTLNPAAARFKDGRTMVYGTMGGDGQPQTQAALFTRYAVFGQPLQQTVTAPRWLLGRTWGQSSDSLKVEARIDASVVQNLRNLGHEVEVLESFSESMGHAGAIVAHPGGLIEGAFDPRSNGAAAGY